jgi:hypothetical protein
MCERLDHDFLPDVEDTGLSKAYVPYLLAFYQSHLLRSSLHGAQPPADTVDLMHDNTVVSTPQ